MVLEMAGVFYLEKREQKLCVVGGYRVVVEWWIVLVTQSGMSLSLRELVHAGFLVLFLSLKVFRCGEMRMRVRWKVEEGIERNEIDGKS